MFNIGMMELVLVLLVAFLVVGPKDLPKVARWIARQIKTLRKLIREIKKETGWDEFAAELKDTKTDLDKTLRDADVRADLKDAADEVKNSVNSVRAEVEQSSREVRKEIEGGN